MNTNIPNYLILDTKDSVEYLRSKIGNLLEFNADESKILPLVFNAIRYEEKAELELHYECMDIIASCLGHAYELDIEIIADAMIKFGTVMLYELKKLNAYIDGKLPFEYYKMVGRDVMLTRMLNINDNISVRHKHGNHEQYLS